MTCRHDGKRRTTLETKAAKQKVVKIREFVLGV